MDRQLERTTTLDIPSFPLSLNEVTHLLSVFLLDDIQRIVRNAVAVSERSLRKREDALNVVAGLPALQQRQVWMELQSVPVSKRRKIRQANVSVSMSFCAFTERFAGNAPYPTPPQWKAHVDHVRPPASGTTEVVDTGSYISTQQRLFHETGHVRRVGQDAPSHSGCYHPGC